MISFTSFHRIGRTASRALNDNAPAILTALGTIGAVTTAVLAAQASFEAAKKIADAESVANMKRDAAEPRVELTKKEKVVLVWPLYVMAVGTGTLTCAAIIMSHRISSKRAAVLAAAYALNQDKLEEYQDQIKEKFGIKKEKEARDELAQKKVNRDYDPDVVEEVIHPLEHKVLMREDYTGRFFWSNVEAVNKAVNEINAHILREGSARLSDFYDLVGLSHVSTSDYFGWNRENTMAIDWSTCTTPDGMEAVHSFEYEPHPVQDPERDCEASFR